MNHDTECELRPGGEYHGRRLGYGDHAMPIPCHCPAREQGRAEALHLVNSDGEPVRPGDLVAYRETFGLQYAVVLEVHEHSSARVANSLGYTETRRCMDLQPCPDPRHPMKGREVIIERVARIL